MLRGTRLMGLDQSRGFQLSVASFAVVPPVVNRLCSLHPVEIQANPPGDNSPVPMVPSHDPRWGTVKPNGRIATLTQFFASCEDTTCCRTGMTAA